MTLKLHTVHTVRCDALIHTACHHHTCPSSVVAPSPEVLATKLREEGWLDIYAIPLGQTFHYCPQHRDA